MYKRLRTTVLGGVSRARAFLERNRPFTEVLGGVIVAALLGAVTVQLIRRGNQIMETQALLLDRQAAAMEASLRPLLDFKMPGEELVPEYARATLTVHEWVALMNYGSPIADLWVYSEDYLAVGLFARSGWRGGVFVLIPTDYYNCVDVSARGAPYAYVVGPAEFIVSQMGSAGLWGWLSELEGPLSDESNITLTASLKSSLHIAFEGRDGSQTTKCFVRRGAGSFDETACETLEERLELDLVPHMFIDYLDLSECLSAFAPFPDPHEHSYGTKSVLSLDAGQVRELLGCLIDMEYLEEIFSSSSQH